MSNWRPIETAPKDGTRILLYDGDEMNVASWKGWGSTVHGEWLIKTVALDDYNEDVEVHFPTHWRPLPAPPNQKVMAIIDPVLEPSS